MAFMLDQAHVNHKHFCKICYKGFVSGRALGGHMRAHGVGDNIIYEMGNMAESQWEMEDGGCRSLWRRKGSLRSLVGGLSLPFPSSEEEELAKCLMLLANDDHGDDVVGDINLAAEESISSGASREEEEEEEKERRNTPATNNKGGVFECKACKKVFSSHQALGGHRASHKKVKGCFVARIDHVDPPPAHQDPVITVTRLHHLASPAKRKSKMHECSICHRVFTSGQALGGHKRCHWITSISPETPSPARFQHHHMESIYKRPKFNKPTTTAIDLNLPAPADDVTRNLQVLDHNSHCDDHDQADNDNNYTKYLKQKLDDEAQHKTNLKLAKLSEINHEVSMSGSSSRWLQVGICSTLA